jgi:hypothetical protein
MPRQLRIAKALWSMAWLFRIVMTQECQEYLMTVMIVNDLMIVKTLDDTRSRNTHDLMTCIS